MTVTERLGKRLPIAVDCEQSLFSSDLDRGVHARGSREMREARAPLPSRDFSPRVVISVSRAFYSKSPYKFFF